MWWVPTLYSKGKDVTTVTSNVNYLADTPILTVPWYPMRRKGPVTIGSLHDAEIANLGKVVHDINRCINRIENAGDERIAEILRDISLKVLTDPHLEKKERQKAIKNLRKLAKEASLSPKQRKLGTVKATLTYIWSLVSINLDADLRTYFGMPQKYAKKQRSA